MIKKFSTPLLGLVLIFSLSSCATIFTGSFDSIRFTSNPPDARILIEGADKCHTPCDLRLRRTTDSKYATVRLKGYEDREFELDQTFNMVTLLDIIFPPVAVIDVVTGAVWKYDTKLYHFEMDAEEPEDTE